MSGISEFSQIEVTALDSTGASPDFFAPNGRSQTSQSLSIEFISYRKLLPFDDAPTSSVVNEIVDFSLYSSYDMPVSCFASEAESCFESRAAMSHIVTTLLGSLCVPFGLDVPGLDQHWCPVGDTTEPLGTLELRLLSFGAAIVRKHPSPMQGSPLMMAVIIAKKTFLPPNLFRLAIEEHTSLSHRASRFTCLRNDVSLWWLESAMSTAMSASASNAILPAVAEAPEPVTSDLALQRLNDLFALTKGYDPYAIEPSVQFETVRYDGDDNNGEGETLTCPICLDDVEIGSHVASIPCNHKFHGDCLRKWTEMKKKTCPVCRIRLQNN